MLNIENDFTLRLIFSKDHEYVHAIIALRIVYSAKNSSGASLLVDLITPIISKDRLIEVQRAALNIY